MSTSPPKSTVHETSHRLRALSPRSTASQVMSLAGGYQKHRELAQIHQLREGERDEVRERERERRMVQEQDGGCGRDGLARYIHASLLWHSDTVPIHRVPSLHLALALSFSLSLSLASHLSLPLSHGILLSPLLYFMSFSLSLEPGADRRGGTPSLKNSSLPLTRFVSLSLSLSHSLPPARSLSPCPLSLAF